METPILKQRHHEQPKNKTVQIVYFNNIFIRPIFEIPILKQRYHDQRKNKTIQIVYFTNIFIKLRAMNTNK